MNFTRKLNRRDVKLLSLRFSIFSQLGEEAYRASVGPFMPFVVRAFEELQCPLAAANSVIDQLNMQSVDLATKRLITCAAVDIAYSDVLCPHALH